MHAIITSFHESGTCQWCNKEAEGITVEFSGGFLGKGPLCWRCFQQATRVHHKQIDAVSDSAAAPDQIKAR